MKIGEVFLAVVVAAVIGVVLAKCAETHPKPHTSEKFRSINGLPQTCTGTIGGDTMTNCHNG